MVMYKSPLIRDNMLLYKRWRAMLARCRNTNPKDKNSRNYRFIGFYPRWGKFKNFVKDMGPTFSPELQLERKDNSLGYSPSNCKWVTPKEQSRNTRRNRLITINGEQKVLSAWAELSGVSRKTIVMRIEKGWPERSWLAPPGAFGIGGNFDERKL